MNTYIKDLNNEEMLVSHTGEIVMMEWEKPYMKASIDFLNPSGDVLEIGWGCGYSATRILEHKPKSYTVIECCPNVIARAKEWAKKYPDTPITIVEGTWQTKIHGLGAFDEIYMDDHPLDIDKNSSQLDITMSCKRLHAFVDLCIQNHTRVGSKISSYLNRDYDAVDLSSDSTPFVTLDYRFINVDISNECNYRDNTKKRCTIPLITKVKEYDFIVAQQHACNVITNNSTPSKHD